MKRDLIIIGLGALALAVIGTASYFAFLSDERRRAHLTAEAPAEIVEVFFARGRDPQTGSPDAVNHVRVRFRYTVSGREFSRVATMNKVTGAKFKVGQPAKVCYRPEMPDEAELFEANYGCAPYIIGKAYGVVMRIAPSNNGMHPTASQR